MKIKERTIYGDNQGCNWVENYEGFQIDSGPSADVMDMCEFNPNDPCDVCYKLVTDG